MVEYHVCPLMTAGSDRQRACLKDECELWVYGECAFIGIVTALNDLTRVIALK